MSSLIKIADKSDLELIMQFIDHEWKKDHILSRDRNFFLYEHGNNDQINFVISKDESGNIIGVLGFIKASSQNDSDLWTVIWKVAKGSNSPMLGVELLEYLRGMNPRSIMSPGINTATIGIYNFLGIDTGVMDHYVFVNPKIIDFKIAQFPNEMKGLPSCQFEMNKSYNLKKLSADEVSRYNFELYLDSIPYKDKSYFIKRYFNHPIYVYDVYGLTYENKILALLVTRQVSVGDAFALRIVDFIGDEFLLENVRHELKELVEVGMYEYMDFVCYGFNEMALARSNFKKIDLDKNDIIVPNYFSPFLRENIKIHFFADVKKNAAFKICKADGDQDRPS